MLEGEEQRQDRKDKTDDKTSLLSDAKFWMPFKQEKIPCDLHHICQVQT